MRFHCGQTPESPFVRPATSRKQDFLHHRPVSLKACLKTTTADPHLGHIAHGILEVQLMEDAEDVVTVLPRRRLHQQFRHPLLLKMIPPSEPTGRFKCIFFQTVKTQCWVNLGCVNSLVPHVVMSYLSRYIFYGNKHVIEHLNMDR